MLRHASRVACCFQCGCGLGAHEDSLHGSNPALASLTRISLRRLFKTRMLGSIVSRLASPTAGCRTNRRRCATTDNRTDRERERDRDRQTDAHGSVGPVAAPCGTINVRPQTREGAGFSPVTLMFWQPSCFEEERCQGGCQDNNYLHGNEIKETGLSLELMKKIWGKERHFTGCPWVGTRTSRLIRMWIIQMPRFRSLTEITLLSVMCCSACSIEFQFFLLVLLFSN